MDQISLAISLLALAISGLTGWLTLLKRGEVKMTQPTVIYFGPDGSREALDHSVQKVFLRSLLFSTSKRGRVIESMFAVLRRNETRQTFNIWVYGDDQLRRGSGLYVGEDGLVTNHHFLMPKDGSSFSFVKGRYQLEIYANVLGATKPSLLLEQELDVSSDCAKSLSAKTAGLYFDWGSDSKSYLAHVEERPPQLDPAKFLERVLAPTDVEKA